MSKKSLIRREAARIFARKGYDATSVDEIAVEVGVAKGTIYYHFDSKRALFASVISDGLDGLLGEAEESIASTSDPVEQLGRVIDAIVDYERRFEDVVYLLFKEALIPGCEWIEEIRSRWVRFVELISGIVAKGRAAGRIRDIDGEAIAHYIVGTLAAAAIGRAARGEGTRTDRGLAGLRSIVMVGVAQA
ncbi:MAG: TetR/AcrR family transcriptional regulator [Clostridia bacterium]|nr:TetR/AcrR family transcriptional regulator [Clostridia bacterium]